MNQFWAMITKIQRVENLHLVSLVLNDIILTMLTLDLPADVKEGVRVAIAVKPSNVMIGKHLGSKMSVSNILPATITKVTQGTLVALIESDVYGVTLQSLLTSQSVEKLLLQSGDEVSLLIQASALSIIEVEDV